MSAAAPRSLAPDERLAWLRLIRSENVGPIAFRRLLGHYGTAERALAALPEIARRGGRARPIKICPEAKARRELEALYALGGRAVALIEPDYPAALAAVEDAPPLIFLRGRIELLAGRCLGLVGARNASANGRRLAQDLARDLGEARLTVVSGLARGIDTAAHRGALASGTIAAVAGGLDVTYPPENAALQAEIAETGLLLSEMPPGCEPRAQHFPRRNRLISGLSLGVLVVEAAPRSGSLITARMALEQGREVFAVPGSPLDPRARGCNDLLRQGATLVETAADVMQAIDGMLQPLKAPPKAKEPVTPDGDESTSSDPRGNRQTIAALLGPAPVTVDELIRQCHLSPAVVNTALLELELAGRAERHPGNRFALGPGDTTASL